MKNHKIKIGYPISDFRKSEVEKSEVGDRRSEIGDRKSPFKALLLAALIGFPACSNWLDVVPDGIATIDMAFNSRVQTLKYLATCYAYMPKNGNMSLDPGLLGGDELTTWYFPKENWIGYDAYFIAQGRQNVTEPLLDTWGSMYQALRDCNAFLENVDRVPDLPEWERDQWVAEVKVLKAYYHFLLVQKYGPIPLVRENLPISVNISDVKVVREPVDVCFQYIVDLLDEAISDPMLLLNVKSQSDELGRITKPVAMALKAKVLVVAASPLFNGNEQMIALCNHDGTPLFNQTYDRAKWEKALVACREAIETCHEANIVLYEFPNTGAVKLTDTIVTQMSLRNAFNDKWNSEIIWANTQSIARGLNSSEIQTNSTPTLNPAHVPAKMLYQYVNVSMKIALLFYSDHGVPLAEDKYRDVNNLYNLRTAQPDEKLYVRTNEVTVDMHFDREPRFYAWIGFDRGVWYGQGRTNDKEPLWWMACKPGETDYTGEYTTGYLAKKWTHYTNVLSSSTEYFVTPYPWPILRLSDLYLLYAEAINEAEGPNGDNSSDLFEYTGRVRERAGLERVKESWGKYAKNPTKYNTPEGMRDIIRTERMIELCLEGHRFWDIRRWKTAPELYRTPMMGWNVQKTEVADYYTPRELFYMSFGNRDYFWPIKNSDIINNPNLVQNVDW